MPADLRTPHSFPGADRLLCSRILEERGVRHDHAGELLRVREAAVHGIVDGADDSGGC